MDAANVDRAVHVLKDKRIAERERVQAEIQTPHGSGDLAETEGEVWRRASTDLGAALKKNPEYLQYDIRPSLPEIYRQVQQGNLSHHRAAPTSSPRRARRREPAAEALKEPCPAARQSTTDVTTATPPKDPSLRAMLAPELSRTTVPCWDELVEDTEARPGAAWLAMVQDHLRAYRYRREGRARTRR